MKQYLKSVVLIPLLLYVFLVPIGLLAYTNHSLASVLQVVKEVAGDSTVSLPISKTSEVSPKPLSQKPIFEPYGITNPTLTEDTILSAKLLGVTWIRLPMLWSTIETGPGAYDWQQLDSIVSLANQHAIHLDFMISNPPPWHMTVCKESRKSFAFGPDDGSSFGSVLANRYNGATSHGFIDAYEIGSEEFDTFGSDSNPTDVLCRNPSYYVPVLKAGYQAIKSGSPKALVGIFGIGSMSKQKIVSYLDGMYMTDPMIGKYFDFGNIVYYNTVVETQGDPTKNVPSDPDYATFSEKVSLMQQSFNQFNDGGKPLWVSEVGWKQPFVTQALQSSYLQDILTSAKQLRVSKVFWFSLSTDGYGLLQDGKPTDSFQSFKQSIKQIPTW